MCVNYVSYLEDDMMCMYFWIFCYISSWMMLDGNVEYCFKVDVVVWFLKVKIRVGVMNLFDEEVLFVVGVFNDGYDMIMYSNCGWFVYV